VDGAEVVGYRAVGHGGAIAVDGDGEEVVYARPVGVGHEQVTIEIKLGIHNVHKTSIEVFIEKMTCLCHFLFLLTCITKP